MDSIDRDVEPEATPRATRRRRVAYSQGSGHGSDVWVRELGTLRANRLTFLEGSNKSPVWTPDGHHVLFRSSSPQAPGIYSIGIDASGKPERLSNNAGSEVPTSIAPDGRHLLAYSEGAHVQIVVAPLEKQADRMVIGPFEPVLDGTFINADARFSPDGLWMAFHSNASGRFEVYVRRLDTGGQIQVSSGGGRTPIWSPDRRRLFFESLTQQLMVAHYAGSGPGIRFDQPAPYRQEPLANSGVDWNYDVGPEGRVVMLDPSPQSAAPTHLLVVLERPDDQATNAPVR